MPRKHAQLAFEALSIEGGLLSPEWLGKIAQLTAGQQTEADYRIRKGLNIRDELGRYWRIAEAEWAEFEAGRRGGGDAWGLTHRFIESLLKGCFGFDSLQEAAPVTISDRVYPLRLQAVGTRVPIITAPAGAGLDTPDAICGDGTRKRTAFGLAQEYLNASEGAMWGLCTDGLNLRIVRDNASLTRPAWIEVDLARLFTERRYADFTALWLLMHESRFGKADQPPSECALEQWRARGREEGTLARDRLRDNVEQALIALGQGFLSYRENASLREGLKDGSIPVQAFFKQLLRLVYRLIFLITAEERDLLFAPDATDAAKKLYGEGYGLKRLRERSAKRRSHDRYVDLYEALRIVFRGLENGEARLGLPALAGLFAANQTPALDNAKLENHALLRAVFRLTWLTEDASLSRVNWRDMGPEELGSVYESLLELVPVITDQGRTFAFASAGESKGNARKTSGSYYTPDSLVQVLLDSALEPVVANTIAAHPKDPVDALLRLSIVDPACGSGHFLLAAARRLAAHVARLQANGTPSPKEYRHAVRQVVGKCIFGVDLNPMAIELCRVALWMEALEPGRPLSFLDSHIQQGNALLGTTPELMKGGIPDDAWVALEGDDKKTTSALKKRNKKERESRDQVTMEFNAASPEVAKVTERVKALEAASDADVSAIAGKQTQWGELLASVEFQHQKLVADAWCAAFVWPKATLPDAVAEAAPTDLTWHRLRDQPAQVSSLTVQTVQSLARDYELFHWHLHFPQVFAKGGFDVVLGNPPWERVKLQEQEFFASRSPEIAQAENAAARKKLIAKLPKENPKLWSDWCTASRVAEGQSHLARSSGRYPLCGKGDVNTYALFAEHNRSCLHPTGHAGFITPPGLATDDTTKAYFQALIAEAALSRLYEFENEEFIFPGIDHRVRFILISVAGRAGGISAADISFGNRNVGALSLPERHFTLTPTDFATLNPNTKTCPTFRSKRDAEINLRIYRRAGVLWREDDKETGNPWGLRFMRMFDMAIDSGLFRSRAQLEAAGAKLQGNRFVKGGEEFLPLIEAKMVHHFDHRFGTYEGQTEAQENQNKLPEFDDKAHNDPERCSHPYYWVTSREVDERLDGVSTRAWLLGWRDICRSTDKRTAIPSLVPRAAVGDKFLLAFSERPAEEVASLYANFASFALDYAARQKVGGTSLKYFTMRQLPFLSPSDFARRSAWSKGVTVAEWILPRVLELTYTSWDMQPFARDLEYEGAPLQWSSDRRGTIRSELDAAFFHLYGLSRDDTGFVMDTFPVVRKNDEKAFGEFRTKRLILERYDALAAAAQSGTPYVTPLNPPPADPAVAHAPKTKRTA